MNGERGEGCVEDVAWGRGDGDDWLGPVSSHRPVIIMNLSYFSLLLCTKNLIGLKDVYSRSHSLIFILLIKVHLQVLFQQIAKIFEKNWYVSHWLHLPALNIPLWWVWLLNSIILLILVYNPWFLNICISKFMT